MVNEIKQMSFKNLLVDVFTAQISETTQRVTQQPSTPVLTLRQRHRRLQHKVANTWTSNIPP